MSREDDVQARIDEVEMQAAAKERITVLFAEYVRAWEADPFEDPSSQAMFDVASEFGDFGLGFAAGLLESYLMVAPEPHHTPEQLERNRAMAERAMQQWRASAEDDVQRFRDFRDT